MIPKNHPRYHSLVTREKLIKHFESGVVARAGLIAHGRGEAFDYLIGEETTEPALRAIKAAACALLLANRPVISVNGNAAALAGEWIIKLADVVNAKIEVNLFYRTKERERAIESLLKSLGAKEVLGVDERFQTTIPELMSERRRVDSRGILIADVVLVPLEDGDRTEALKRMGKTVIAIDLNPLSRTARVASITIVDNIVRAMPKLVEEASRLKQMPRDELRLMLSSYDNNAVLSEALEHMVNRLKKLAGEVLRAQSK
ncbi:MAG: phosphopantothenate/pantothenate synthetase [Candidatus Verstraetearchaeota archaeon]|nr:phosphopantothenate/pantothenate synthetase [Candidatus Verstraetearchaeota archaeon]